MVNKMGETLKPEDVANLIYFAYALEQRIVLPTITILPTGQKN